MWMVQSLLNNRYDIYIRLASWCASRLKTRKKRKQKEFGKVSSIMFEGGGSPLLLSMSVNLFVASLARFSS